MHRVSTHKYRITLRRIVADCRGVSREDGIARIGPIFGIITKGKHLVFEVVHLDIIARNDVLLSTIILKRIAPHLLLGREDIAVAGNHIQLTRLIVEAFVSREIVAIDVPNLARGEEAGELAVGVVDDRVALHIVIGTVQLDIIHTYYIVRTRVIVAAHRLDDIVVVNQNAAIGVSTDALLGVETEIIGVEHSIAIDNLDDRGEDLGRATLTIVERTITIYINRVLIDQHTAEESPARIGKTHGTIARDNGTVMVSGEVSDEIDYAVIAHLVGFDNVSHKIDTAALRGGLLGCCVALLGIRDCGITMASLLRKQKADKGNDSYNGE